MLGVKLMSRINNVGVAAELIGSTMLIILLLFHLHHATARSSSTPTASAPAIRGATSARCSSAAC